MKISLISPKWDQMVLSYPPLGLAYLAAALEQKGHQVNIHAFSLRPESSLEDNAREVATFAPEVVGITAMTNSYYGAIKLAEQIKASIGCPIILGGPHPTVLPERTAAEPSVTCVVCGEGEETVVEVMEALGRGQPLHNIRGICFQQDGATIRTAPRPLLEDLDVIQFPARHLLDLEQFPLRAKDGRLMTTVMTSRGCPYDCSYCFKGLFGRTYRQRSCQNVIAELKAVIRAYGITNFYFIDDLFTVSPKWIDRFTRLLVDEALGIRWQCLARVDRVNPQLLKKMHLAGCREIHFGVESGNQGLLDAVSKHISLDHVSRAVGWARDAGMLTKGYFMLGLPGETENTAEQTIKLACELGLDDAMFSVTTPFPGTRLWQSYVASGHHPQFTDDFARAYYFAVNSGETKPFLNLSSLPDDRLMQLAAAAPHRFAEHRHMRLYGTVFGDKLGALIWRISHVAFLRIVARRLKRFGGLRRLSADTDDTARLWA